MQSVAERVAGRYDETNNDDQARTHLRLQCKSIGSKVDAIFFIKGNLCYFLDWRHHWTAAAAAAMSKF